MNYLMKCIAVLIILFIINACSLGQIFNSGKIGVELSSIGRITVFSPLSNTPQVYRISIIAAADKNSVFSYIEDQDSVTSSKNILSPGQSDYEIRGIINNSFSNTPPFILARFSIYGWVNEPYALIKVTLINMDTHLRDISPFIGFEFLPQVDSTFGYEAIKYNRTEEVITSFRRPSSTVTGIKMLPSGRISSLNIIDWKDYYERGTGSDSVIYNLMSSGVIDSSLTGGPLGASCLLAQSPVRLKLYDSTEVYLAVALGKNETEVLSSINEAEHKIAVPLSVERQLSHTAEFNLKQNYPNPFNHTTNIEFSIPERNHVSLKVYDMTGKEVASLVDAEMESGSYKLKFDHGVYLLAYICSG